MHRELQAALNIVLPELVATTGLTPTIRDDQWSDVPDQECAMLLSQHGSSVGIWVMSGIGSASQIAELADQIQEWAHEELLSIGKSPTWPECPEHPDSHPLSPKVSENLAVWRCPKSLRVIANIGQFSG